MQGNKGLEVQCIVDSINKQNKIETTTLNYELAVNEKLRLIEPKKILNKTRYNISPYSYTITNISGKLIAICDVDDSVKIVTRSLVILIEASTKIKRVKSIGGNMP
jgi:hypothetical protein